MGNSEETVRNNRITTKNKDFEVPTAPMFEGIVAPPGAALFG